MSNKWINIFIILTGTVCIMACHNAPKTPANPVFKTPALKGISEKIDKNPKDASLYFQRGNILHQMGIDTLAIQDFKMAATLDSTKAVYFSSVGNLLFDHKDITGSVEWLKKAIALDPKDPKAHLKMAKMFIYTSDFPRAFNEINTVLKRDPYNAEPYFLKGILYEEMKDTAKAISSLQTALQITPEYKDALIEVATIYSGKGDSIALKYYDNAFKLDTLDPFPIYGKGVFFQALNNYPRAKAEYHQCLLVDNQYANAYFNMGYMLLQEDSLEKAWRQFDLVTKIEPNNAGAYYNRGLCSEMMKKKQDAVTDYTQALTFNGKYKPAIDGLKRLGAPIPETKQQNSKQTQ